MTIKPVGLNDLISEVQRAYPLDLPEEAVTVAGGRRFAMGSAALVLADLRSDPAAAEAAKPS